VSQESVMASAPARELPRQPLSAIENNEGGQG
jgi:hypothetical protein